MKSLVSIVSILMVMTLICGCGSSNTTNNTTVTPAAEITNLPQGTDGYPWWNDTTFYEIFVRSFFDSDGDGIGDFNGITEKLDYLNDGNPDTITDLGITGIWLMPINPSPSYHGYSITDYFTVNSDYGTLDDFKNLLEEAHARGIRIIIDLVLNHTSDQHPWFRDAYDTDSPYHDWYIWSDFDPGYGGSWGQKVWYPYKDKYYYATYDKSMPDLNYENPEVRAEMKEVARFWLEDVKVDGFRLDGAKHIIEEGRVQANSASTHTWWKEFNSFYKGINPEAVTVGEIWDETIITAEYLQGDQFDLSFEFKLATAFIDSVNRANAFNTKFQMKFSYNNIPSIRFCTFLANHDQNRLMDQLKYDEGKVKAAASLLLTSPGVPFLYYGEEIGMQGMKPDEKIRAPMQWSSEAYAGFSSVTPWQAIGSGVETYNIASEVEDPNSILSHYRSLIQIRNQHSALRVGTMGMVNTGSGGLYSILRESEEETVLILINLSEETISDYALSLESSGLSAGSYSPSIILGEGTALPVTINSAGGFFQYTPFPEIPAYTTVIIKL